jgi:hypothetical protein
VPTFAWLARFAADFDALAAEQQRALLAAVAEFVKDLEGGGPFRKSLGVKGIKGAAGLFEMTWAPDGRATFEYGDDVVRGEPHIVWRRIGAHAIFRQP